MGSKTAEKQQFVVQGIKGGLKGGGKVCEGRTAGF